ncbi:hypothetical protein SLS62_002574 [Diatrype stigma]|uniref:Uncharacterized protein n=1 Tax=Diatrype stigma TaxID=117547 RepID=A0AAN9V894_9PEZI
MQLRCVDLLATGTAAGLLVGLAAGAATRLPGSHSQQQRRDGDGGGDPHFIYEQAYRLRVVPNTKYDSSTYDSIDDILPALAPDQNNRPRGYWFGYEKSQRTHGRRNIAIAFEPSSPHHDDSDGAAVEDDDGEVDDHSQPPLAEVPVFYEQIWRQNQHSETWAAYTDLETWRRLTWDAQAGDEFERDYPTEHGVYITWEGEGDLATGAPAPSDPPHVLLAPGTFLACAGRRYEDREVGGGGIAAVIRFAYDYLNETEPNGRFPRGCAPVRLESRCARLEAPRFNRTWSHEGILDIPCVKVEDEWW